MSYVYVIEARNGLIKIGCSQNPAGRAATVATHSPVQTRLIAMWPGAMADESALHTRFRDFRQHREWFCIVGPVAEFVATNFGRGLESVQSWDDQLFWSGADGRETRHIKRSLAIKERFKDPEYRRHHAINLRAARINREAFEAGTRPKGEGLIEWIHGLHARAEAEYDAAQATRHRRSSDDRANLESKVA
jgi:hypothetical protein